MTRTCVCWWCEKPGTVLMELVGSCAGDRREWFCAEDAKQFDNCWTRVEAFRDSSPRSGAAGLGAEPPHQLELWS